MDRLTDGYLISLFPPEKRLIPSHTMTQDRWVIGDGTLGNNTFFRTQWIQCSYPISSGYGHSPRYIFYLLVLVSVVARAKRWIVSVALGSVMIYSSVASIHALVYVIIRENMAPAYMFRNYETVPVLGLPNLLTMTIQVYGCRCCLWPEIMTLTRFLPYLGRPSWFCFLCKFGHEQ